MTEEVKNISVTITDRELAYQKADYTGEMYIMRKLRAAGIPIKAAAGVIQGVERGTLSAHYSPVSGGVTYYWRDDA